MSRWRRLIPHWHHQPSERERRGQGRKKKNKRKKIKRTRHRQPQLSGSLLHTSSLAFLPRRPLPAFLLSFSLLVPLPPSPPPPRPLPPSLIRHSTQLIALHCSSGCPDKEASEQTSAVVCTQLWPVPKASPCPPSRASSLNRSSGPLTSTRSLPFAWNPRWPVAPPSIARRLILPPRRFAVGTLESQPAATTWNHRRGCYD